LAGKKLQDSGFEEMAEGKEVKHRGIALYFGHYLAMIGK
jgi:hypothetical protein